MEVEEEFESVSEEAGGIARAGQNVSFPLTFPFVILSGGEEEKGKGLPYKDGKLSLHGLLRGYTG